MLGDPPLEVHLEHAAGFRSVAEEAGLRAGPGSLLDLGSGAGLPGLALASWWPDARATLLDANERRCAALREVVVEAGWEGRVTVVQARAERAGREVELRGSFDLVVARSFASPPVTAECAAPFLRVGGLLIVSEPPLDGVAEEAAGDPVVGHPARWPVGPLAALGLEPSGFSRGAFGYQVLRQVALCPDRYPRREGVPGKRPLY